MVEQLPAWLAQSIGLLLPAGRIVLIVIVALVLRRLSDLLVDGIDKRYGLPKEFGFMVRRLLAFIVFAAALLLCLEQLGVSGTVLWTAFTGFATVAAVAFFAAWSVLSNIFCSVLIFTMRPFRLLDHIELIESGDKPGLRGQVIDVNLLYTTLEEIDENGRPTVLQIPNSLFFQRTTRRWRGTAVPLPRPAAAKPDGAVAAAGPVAATASGDAPR